MNEKQGSGPDWGRSPVEWGEILEGQSQALLQIHINYRILKQGKGTADHMMPWATGLTMPTNNKLSLNDRGATFALRGEGYSLSEIGYKLVIKRRAEKIAWKNLISIPLEYLNSLYESMPSKM